MVPRGICGDPEPRDAQPYRAPPFNYSDVAGNGIAAAVSNLYHPSEDRSWSATLTRWGTQMMWDVLSDELKEFWPDIRRRIRKP